MPFALLFAPAALGADTAVLGHVKYQPNYLYYGDAQPDQAYHSLDLRLGAKAKRGDIEAEAHYEILGLASPSINGTTSVVAAANLPNDDARMLDLTDVVAKGDGYYAVQRLDRLSVGYVGSTVVTRLGRQAVTWGNGFVYNPMDIFNPFAPTAVDKDYKTGDDMLYAQWLLASGADWQFIFVPRRATRSGAIEHEESSTAIKYHNTTSRGDADLVVAQHRGSDLIGLGYAADINKTVWRIDATAARKDAEKTAIALTTNIDYSWSWWGRSVYGFAEYYHNNLGQTAIDLATASSDLLAAIDRGEAYTLGRHYGAAGLTLEVAPLLSLSGTLIINLDDRSSLVPLRVNFEVGQNITLNGGVNLALGRTGTEFGGLPDPGSPTYLRPPQTVYARLAYYF